MNCSMHIAGVNRLKPDRDGSERILRNMHLDAPKIVQNRIN